MILLRGDDKKKPSEQKSILKPNWDQISLKITLSNVSSISYKNLKIATYVRSD